MPYWQVHFLNARHDLTGIMPELRTAIADSVALASDHARVPDFDVVVRAGEGIPDWGVGGAAPAPGVIELTVAPARFADGDPVPLIRTMLHELHHILRWDGPGYGRSLGEALVSEGLAGHFVTQVLGGAPDPWDQTPPTAGLAKRAITEWARRDYDHALWFQGRGNLRKWAGYGLAHRLLADHLDANPGETAVTLAHVPAETLRPAMRRLSGSDFPEEPADAPGNAPPAEPDQGRERDAAKVEPSAPAPASEPGLGPAAEPGTTP
ncbi:DUF2268 domain-containing putative Zn-dependent protease [Paracoccus marinus]|uniref:DUF2268 domain-containing putative Zn-dependent protease n=1 Tax=Paracoccus marinus TaxID=288426 RepID=UPI001040496D|nr:DUF2268 domain-containing putative Zn-dependent protease [Paracoccus marinus]GLS81512.1 hypothetical protein GCM10007893_23220 [Paracoccus marinus]